MLAVIILGFLGGIAKAMRDTIAHHFERSVFSGFSGFWFKWFLSYPGNKPTHPIWFLWDGWHFADNFQILMFLLAISSGLNWLDAIVFGICFGLAFRVFYHHLFLNKE